MLNRKYKIIDVRSGVPHGFVLGPIIFLTAINDAVGCCKNKNQIVYVDDTTIIYIRNNIDNLTRSGQDALSNWLRISGFVFNE